jgi:hypothetical protein
MADITEDTIAESLAQDTELTETDNCRKKSKPKEMNSIQVNRQ